MNNTFFIQKKIASMFLKRMVIFDNPMDMTYTVRLGPADFKIPYEALECTDSPNDILDSPEILQVLDNTKERFESVVCTGMGMTRVDNPVNYIAKSKITPAVMEINIDDVLVVKRRKLI